MDKIYAYFKKIDSKQKNIYAFTLLFLLTLIIYGKTIFFSYCIDDQYYLWLLPSDGISFRDYIGSLKQRFWGQEYRPVTFATLLFESLIFGKTPTIHHIFNLIYYTLLCFSIYLFCNKFFKKYYQNYYGLSLLIALLFLIHASHANVVSSIKNRETILSLLFGISAFYFWLKFLDNKKWYFIALSVLMIIIGSFAKKDILPFIFIIPLGGLLYKPEIRIRSFLVSFGIMFFGIILGASIIENFIADYSASQFVMQGYENILVDQNIPFLKRIPFALDILARYEKFMIWPFEYYFYFGYDVIPIVTTWNLSTILLITFHLSIMIFCIYLFKKGQKQYLIGPIIFFLSIAPFIFSLVTGYIAVRYSFIASLGFCIFLAQSIYYLISSSSRWQSNLGYLSMMIIIIASSWFSFNRSSAWKDIDTLYSTDIPKIKRSANANRMACQYYYIISEEEADTTKQRMLIQKSQYYCDQALSIYEIPVAIDYKAKGFMKLNKPEKALPLYDKLLMIDNKNIDALSFFAYDYKYKGNIEASIFHFEKLIRADSSRTEAFIELTQLYITNNQFEAAIGLNKYFYNLGNQYDALLNFGDVYIEKGDTLSALKNYNVALKYKQEDYIMEAVLEIAKAVGNDTMIVRLENLLQNF